MEGQTDVGKATKMVGTTNQREMTMAASHGEHESVNLPNVKKMNWINHTGKQQQPMTMKGMPMMQASQEKCAYLNIQRRARHSLPISQVSYDAGSDREADNVVCTHMNAVKQRADKQCTSRERAGARSR